jgi:amidase
MAEAESDSSRRGPSQRAGTTSGEAKRRGAAEEGASTALTLGAPELCLKTAVELVELIRRREVSVSEVVRAHLEQVERINPEVNAICTLVAEQAVDEARRADDGLEHGVSPGPLFGLPIAIKDLVDTQGIRTTYGSPIYRDRVPDQDELVVERLKEAGAIVIGKANVPEFGAGSQTLNPVFGVTRNPYDLTKTCGGSSGGGAVALACGMVPIADGSDTGGSVRNPPNFNNVVGLRPSPGRIPIYPNRQPWDTLSVLGSMARTVRDAGLLLSVMAGPDPRDPISIPEDPSGFRSPLDRELAGSRIAWSRDLGQFPVQQVVIDVIEKALPTFADLDCRVEEAHPDFSDAPDIFHVLRAQSYAFAGVKDLEEHRELIKDTVVWNIEEGLKLSALDVSRAQARRAALFHRVREFFERYEFLVLPVSQVVPFPVEVEWVKEINGIKMDTYIDWMMSCSFISLTAHPAMSVPCGFTPEGLPVGIQIVGRYRREMELLQFAHAFEQATRVAERRPSIAL